MTKITVFHDTSNDTTNDITRDTTTDTTSDTTGLPAPGPKTKSTKCILPPLGRSASLRLVEIFKFSENPEI